MTQAEKAKAFAALHIKGNPLILYNAWDAGSAAAITRAGARAVATSSWAVAATQGFGDGQDIPLDETLAICARVVAATELPVSVDFEGGYAVEPDAVAANIHRLLATGAIGINFEDSVIGTTSLHDTQAQCARIAAARSAADAAGIALFINARTDVFLPGRSTGSPDDMFSEALERARAYQAAGANGIFVPRLVEETMIERFAAACDLPLNILLTPGAPSPARLRELGVARISHGHFAYVAMIEAVEAAAKAAFV
jgi:2-methylisocitrate lyase-like PEP mutase family enzyme